MYLVENTVRNVGTRGHRAKSPTRHRFKQFVSGMRVLRGRKLTLTDEQFAAAKDQLEGMVLAGTAAVILPDGKRVSSLPTGEFTVDGQVSKPACFGGKAAAPPPAPKKEAAPPPAPEPDPEPVAEEPKKTVKKWRKKELPPIAATKNPCTLRPT